MTNLPQDSRTKTLTATAYHEAGHAVAAYFLGVRLKSVTIEPGDDSAVRTHHQDLIDKRIEYEEITDRTRLNIERTVMICLAGQEAQKCALVRDLLDAITQARMFETL